MAKCCNFWCAVLLNLRLIIRIDLESRSWNGTQLDTRDTETLRSRVRRDSGASAAIVLLGCSERTELRRSIGNSSRNNITLFGNRRKYYIDWKSLCRSAIWRLIGNHWAREHFLWKTSTNGDTCGIDYALLWHVQPEETVSDVDAHLWQGLDSRILRIKVDKNATCRIAQINES